MILRVSDEASEVTKRFFKALEYLKEQKIIHGLKTFTDRYSLNYWNFTTIKNEPEKRFLKVDYLIYLCRDYGINADWLLLGKGDMVKKPPRPKGHGGTLKTTADG